MEIFFELNFILLISALAVNSLLGFLVWKSNSKSATHKIFVALCLTTGFWLCMVYFSKNNNFSNNELIWIRLTLFFAVPQSFFFFLIADTIPSEKLLIPSRLLKIFIGIALLIMIFTVSPYTFTHLETVNGVASPVPGPGLISFILFALCCSVAAILILIKKFEKAVGPEKKQFKLVMLGALLMLGLIILTIFFPVIIFRNSFFVPFAPFYVLIFLSFTAYSIVKYHLFNLKIVATEAFSVLLWVILFSKILVASTINEKVVDFFIFTTSAIFGVLLIKSVRREVEQRQELEILTTELGKANEKLKELDAARAEFITIASHQLRTPPATIKWYLSAAMAGDYGKLPKEVGAVIEKAAITNNHLISLIEDMLNVSRIERGKMEFLFEPTNTDELARFAYEQLIPMALNKKLKLTYNPPPKYLPEIMADKEKLRQVMNNLIDNAIKYTKQGSVTVSLMQLGDEINFRVEDTGKGISEEEKDSIFQKYSRGKESVKQSAGLGLGLYVAKIIIEQHKGKVWAESKGEGKGSSFCFSLPINSGLTQTTLVDLSQPASQKS